MKKKLKNDIINLSKVKSAYALSKFFLSALTIILFFYTTPLIINFAEKNFNHKEFTNNSKNILNDALNKKELTQKNNTSVKNDDMILEFSTDPELIHDYFQNKVDMVISGGYGDSTPSTIVKCTGNYPEIIRKGKGDTSLFD